MGIADGENLFLGDGAWDRSAYVRRYPFCMARVNLDKVEQADRLICVEKDVISDQTDPASLQRCIGTGRRRRAYWFSYFSSSDVQIPHESSFRPSRCAPRHIGISIGETIARCYTVIGFDLR